MHAIIVTYNRLSYLKTTIQKSLAFGFDEIIVVDNASTDGTTQYLESLSNDKISVLSLAQNTGGAGGFYEGLKFLKSKYQTGWCCLFDDDSYPETSRIVVDERLKTYCSKTGAVAAAVFLPDGGISEMNRVGVNPFKSKKALYTALKYGRAGFHVANTDYYAADKKVIDTASFVGCFVNIKALHETEVMPRKEFFIYGDDVLFTYQLTASGYQNYFDPQIKFIHDCYSYDKNSVFQQLWKVYFLYRNGLEVYRHISKELFPLVAVRYLAIWLNRTRYYGPNKGKYLKIMQMAVKDWLLKDYKKTLPEVIAQIKSF